MTQMQYQRRPHRSRHQCFEYTRASRGGDYVIWAHLAYVILIGLAVLGVTVVLGYWSPAL